MKLIAPENKSLVVMSVTSGIKGPMFKQISKTKNETVTVGFSTRVHGKKWTAVYPRQCYVVPFREFYPR